MSACLPSRSSRRVASSNRHRSAHASGCFDCQLGASVRRANGVQLRCQQVPGNLANFLKQASLDSAMAALQQREATPPTPHMRQLPSGAGAVWPFALGPPQVPSLRPGGMPPGGLPPSAQLDGTPQRLGTLNLQSPLLRSVLTHPFSRSSE